MDINITRVITGGILLIVAIWCLEAPEMTFRSAACVVLGIFGMVLIVLGFKRK